MEVNGSIKTNGIAKYKLNDDGLRELDVCRPVYNVYVSTSYPLSTFRPLGFKIDYSTFHKPQNDTRPIRHVIRQSTSHNLSHIHHTYLTLEKN